MRRQEIYMKYNKTTWFSIIHSSGKEAMAAILDLSLLKDLSPLNSTFVVSMTTGHASGIEELENVKCIRHPYGQTPNTFRSEKLR